MAKTNKEESEDKIFLDNQADLEFQTPRKPRIKQESSESMTDQTEPEPISKETTESISTEPSEAVEVLNEAATDTDSELVAEEKTDASVETRQKSKSILSKEDSLRRSKSGKKSFIKDRLMKVIRGNARLIIALIPITFVVLMIIAILSQTIVIYSTNAQKLDYEKRTSELKLDLTTRIDSVNALYTEERVKNILTQDDLYVFTNTFWTYELLVNDVAVKEDAVTLPASSGTVSITLRETRKASELPDTIIAIGSVTRGDKGDTLSSHIKLVGDTTQGTLKSEGFTTSYQFVKQNLKAGDKITIELSDQLGSKLNMPFAQITVTLK